MNTDTAPANIHTGNASLPIKASIHDQGTVYISTPDPEDPRGLNSAHSMIHYGALPEARERFITEIRKKLLIARDAERYDESLALLCNTGELLVIRWFAYHRSWGYTIGRDDARNPDIAHVGDTFDGVMIAARLHAEGKYGGVVREIRL